MSTPGDPGDPGWRPPHAYLPGATPRHADDLFDPVRDSAQPGMAVEELRASLAWREGRAYLDEGFYWEAHEVMEAVWLVLPDGPERRRVQAVIQLANAALKARMARPGAVTRLAGIVRDLVARSDGPESERWMTGAEIEHHLSKICEI